MPEDGRVGVGLRSMRTAWGQARGERARGQPSHLPGRLSQLLKLGTPQQRRRDPCQQGREGVAGEPRMLLGRAGREVLCRRGHGRAGAWRPAGGEERAPSPAEGDAHTRQLLPSRQFAQGPLLRGGAAPGRPAPGRLASWCTWGDGGFRPPWAGGQRGEEGRRATRPSEAAEMPKKKPFPAAPPSQRAEQTQLLPPGGAREPLGLHYFVVLAAREFPRRNGKVRPAWSLNTPCNDAARRGPWRDWPGAGASRRRRRLHVALLHKSFVRAITF